MSSAEEHLLRELMKSAYRDINPEMSEHGNHLIRKLASGIYARGVRVDIGARQEPKVRTIHASVDRDQRLMWTCKEWREVMGYPQRGAIGQPAIDFLAPSSREIYTEFIWPRVTGGEKVEGVTLFLLRSDGDILPATSKIEPMRDLDGSFFRTFARFKVTLLLLFSLYGCAQRVLHGARRALDSGRAYRVMLMA